jgi:hypothetical protein
VSRKVVIIFSYVIALLCGAFQNVAVDSVPVLNLDGVHFLIVVIVLAEIAGTAFVHKLLNELN